MSRGHIGLPFDVMLTYQYNATVIDVHDGDTMHLDVDLKRSVRGTAFDLGFSVYGQAGHLHVHEDFRLLGINAPELANPDGSGIVARDALRARLEPTTAVIVHTVKQADHEKQEKYGRWLATVWLSTQDPRKDQSLNDWMIANGYAVPFMV